jgi:membrane protease YdiL (CAAX protease family)
MGSERNGRRAAALSLLVAAPAPTVGALFAFFLAPGPVGNAVYLAGKAVLYGTPAAWRLLVERRRPSFAGCPPREALLGLGVGLVMAGGILAIGLLAGDRLVDGERLRSAADAAGIGTPARFLMLAAWLSFVNALLEEFVFRWFMTERLETLLPRGAAVASAGVFATHHLVVLLAYAPVAAAIAGTAAVFAAGLAWTWLYRRSRSVVPGWIAHILADLAIFALGYRLLFTV